MIHQDNPVFAQIRKANSTNKTTAYTVSLNGETMTTIEAKNEDDALSQAVKQYGLEVDVSKLEEN